MRLTAAHLLLLSQFEIPSWDEIEQLMIELDDSALSDLREVVRRILSGCEGEDEARTEGTSKRKD